MAQFKVGDPRERALYRWIIDEDGNVLGGLANPIAVQSTPGGEAFVVTQGAAGAEAWPISIPPVVCAAVDVHEPAANIAAVVTYAGVAGIRHVITGLAWSYVGGIPAGGTLTVTDAGNTVFVIGISEEGPGFITFPSPKRSAAVNTPMVATLAAGGAGITGKINILNHWTE